MHAMIRVQRVEQFVAFTIFPAKTYGEYTAHAKGKEVVENGSRSPGLRTHVDDVVRRATGFNGEFIQRGINLEITIQAEIAQQTDAEVGIAGSELGETLGVHQDSRRACSRPCINARLSDWT